jgi:dTMP kinase
MVARLEIANPGPVGLTVRYELIPGIGGWLLLDQPVLTHRVEYSRIQLILEIRNRLMPGIFVTFEGGEACGKSTQVARLAKKLESTGRPVVLIREPGSTRAGEMIRQLLLHSDPGVNLTAKTELLLFAASRAQMVEEIVLPALEAGKLVLADRFTDSTTVYQGLARGLDLKFLRHLEEFVCCGVRPEVTFLLDLDLEAMRKRQLRRVRPVAATDRMERLPLEFHQKVREGYLQLAREFPDRIRLINAAQPEAEVEAEIWKEINALLS